MQNHRPFPPQRPAILPPLSKYYYGPAVSPDRSPAHVAETGWDAPIPQQNPPTLPPRPTPNPPSAPIPSQRDGFPQQSRLPGPPPIAAQTHPVAQSSYNPNTYGLMPGARLSPVNPTRNHTSYPGVNDDPSRWSVNHNHVADPKPKSELKPPLPPRALSHQILPSGSSPESEVPHSHEHGSLEYLRPVAYSPAPSPSIPQGFTPQSRDQSQPLPQQHEPSRLPPPPPRKIPIADASAQSQEHTAPLNQLNQYGDSMQSLDQDVGSEVHLADNNISQQASLAGTLLAATIENSGRNASLHAGHNGGVRDNDGDHARKVENPNGDVYDSSYRQEQQRDRRMSWASVDAQNKKTPPENLHRNNSVASSAEECHAESSSSVQVQRDDSFYWHSPHSSAGVSHDRDQNQDIPGTSSLLDATPEPQDQHTAPPPSTQNHPKPISNTEQTADQCQSTIGRYSASALGFGGPSDWEHFGDYDGEEIDDTDLYIRPRSPAKSERPVETSELPGDAAPMGITPKQHLTTHNETNRTSSAVRPVEYEAIQSSGPWKAEPYQNEAAGRDIEKSYEITQSVLSGQQAPISSSMVAQEFSVKQRPVLPGTPRTYLPQFPFEEEQHNTEVLVYADNGIPLDCHDDATVSPVLVRSSSPTDKHSGGPTVDAGDVGPRPTAETNEESLADTKKMRTDSEARNEVQLPEIDLNRTQSEHESQPQPDDRDPPLKTDTQSTEESMKRESLVSNGSLIPRMENSGDPYADLDLWGKASLDRYVLMLHEEASAPTDQEKLNNFKVFVKKEWRLRVILYGGDDEQGDDFPIANEDPAVSKLNTIPLRRPASKALPALPPDADQPNAKPTQPKYSEFSPLRKPSLATLVATKDASAPHSAGEDSYVMVDNPGAQRQQQSESDTTESYNPGGQPTQVLVGNARRHISQPGANDQGSAVNMSLPNAAAEEATEGKPAYTPFRYSQGYVDDAVHPVDRRASFRPYAALKLEPIEARQEIAPEPVKEAQGRDVSTSTDNRHLGRLAPSVQALSDPKDNTADCNIRVSSTLDQKPLLDLRRFEKADFDPLIAVLPQCSHIPNSAMEVSDFQVGMNAVQDDFSFIHQHVVAWDTKAKKIRTENEKERHIRQGELEQRIDALFNDDEIGYGDISELESEFKRAEAARKTDEDRLECHTFVEEVFNAVWTRLHFEIDQLSPLYNQYSILVHETLAGKDMFEAKKGQYALAPTMSALLALYQKLEIRHQKAFEAVLERDRRLKKTEVALLYTLGNVSKVKQLEQQFESAERKAIAEYCKQRNLRANRLMDVLDQNTLRGVGANQDYMEAVMKAVRRIASGRAFASAPASEPGLGIDEVIKAKAVTAVLAGSSEQIVQTFHVADMLLNAADCELSLATARQANADMKTLERLKDERVSKEAKLIFELNHRLALIREDSRRTNDEIVKLLCFLGVQGGHAQGGNVPKSPPIPDPEHEHRLHKALEDAKRRNAPNVAVAGLPRA
ncbi:MAG: hypothetical protein LQ341_000632 [Variospora aurantia]|nr:MAG: hypothetical protein LQ341_000632 [Variospora aurantia]